MPVDARIQDDEFGQMRLLLDQVAQSLPGLLGAPGPQVGQGQAVVLGGAVAETTGRQIGAEVGDGLVRVLETLFT